MENSKQIFFCENCKKPILVFWDKKGRFCSRSCLSAYTAKITLTLKPPEKSSIKKLSKEKLIKNLRRRK